jgi:hypothetical protein
MDIFFEKNYIILKIKDLTPYLQNITFFVAFCKDKYYLCKKNLQMQTVKFLEKTLSDASKKGTYIFGLETIGVIFPDFNDENLRMITSRAVKNGVLIRICNGVFLYAKSDGIDYSSILYRTARYLRRNNFNYLSLESVLSEESIISQQMFAWITVMTTGRSGIIDCGKFGHIEFVHTAKAIEKLSSEVNYDKSINMFRATPKLALSDMRRCRRSTLDLVDLDEYNRYYENV